MKLSQPKFDFDSSPCSAFTVVKVHRKCRCLQRLRSSLSDPCLACLASLLPRRQALPARYRRHFTASGESGFGSDSDNLLCHRRYKFLSSKATSLCTDRSPRTSRHFRTLSFPLSVNTLKSSQSHYQPMPSKDESNLNNQVNSFEGSTPVKFVPNRTNNSLEEGIISSISPIVGSVGRNLPFVRGTLVSPSVLDELHQSSPLRRQRRSSSINESTLSIPSSTDAELDSDNERNITLSRGTGGEPEDDSALVASPTSSSLVSQDSDNEEGSLSAGWNILQALRTPPCGNRPPGDTNMGEAYAPVTSTSNDSDADEYEPKDDLIRNTRTNDLFSLNLVVDGSTCQRTDWSLLTCRSEELANLAVDLRLLSRESAVLHDMLQDGTKLVKWLSDLEISIYSPSEDSSTFKSDSLCRLRPGLVRAELDKHLSELQLNMQKVEYWRQEVDNLITKHKERLGDFENPVNKLLASDHGILAFVPSWLDVINRLCFEVEQGLRFQLHLSDCLTSVSAETEKKLQEIENQAEPVLAEAAYLVRHLGTSRDTSGKNTDTSRFTQNVSAVISVVERLQDLLENASELNPRLNLLRRESVGPITKSQILRARLRNSLANLQTLCTSLFGKIGTHPHYPNLMKAPRSVPRFRRCTGLTLIPTFRDPEVPPI
ncbi:hypothetical protein Aperf_G00000128008 [Anoplocephala perfoliata]